MFTLQILDRGQTLYHPLTDQPLVVGSAADAGLRLTEAGVAAHHARLQPVTEPEPGVTLVAMDGEVKVNGAAVDFAPLHLGDRIEIGRAVIVVGKSVVRPVQPEDVLAGSVSRRRSPPRRRGANGTVIQIAIALLLASGVTAYVLTAERKPETAWSTAELDRLRQSGDFAGARNELAALRARIGDDTRLRQRARDEEILLQDVSNLVERQRRAIVNDRNGDDFGTLSVQLDQTIASTDQPAVREASKIVRAELLQLLQQRGALQVAAAQTEAEAEAAAQAKALAQAGSGNPATGAAGSSAPGSPMASGTLVEVDRMAKEGRFAQALQMIEADLENVSQAQAAVLQTRAGQLRDEALRDAERVAAAATARAQQGQIGEALADLAAAAQRFPAGAASDRLTTAQHELQALAAALEKQRTQQRVAAARGGAASTEPDEAVRRVSLEQLRSLMDQIRACEAAGDYARVAQLQREGADKVDARDPAFAERLRQKAAEAEQIAGLQAAAVEAFAAGRKVDVALRSGQVVSITSAQGFQLLAGEQKVGWPELTADSVLRVLDQGRLPAKAWLGGAVLAYRSGDASTAESMLAKALTADATIKTDVDRVVARGRGERIDSRGYELQKNGGFVSARSIDAKKDSEKLLARLETALKGKDTKVRDAFVTDVLAQGPDALEAVVLAFKKEFQRQLDTLDKSNLKKQVEKLAAQRAVLDGARQYAKDLIFDEVKYFYPYRPPAVSQEKAKQYDEVQLEVDHRVAALRAVWNDLTIKVKVPASLRDELDRLDWTAKVLADLAELDASSLAAVEWARALPPGEVIDVHNYCRTPTERAEWLLWERIEAGNRVYETKVSSAQREQLKVTNDYRAMYRHRPLSLNAKLCAAATSHADEMSKLGYFAHFSPTPGRRSPFDRMKLAGYDHGASENIALCDGAQGAHDAWCHSSGHHRNLLSPSHTEFGIGAQGRYWVQNFGNGAEYEKKL